MKVQYSLIVIIGCLLVGYSYCDVSELIKTSTSKSKISSLPPSQPITDSSTSLTITIKKDVTKRDDGKISLNLIGFQPIPLLRNLRMSGLDLMEVNGLAYGNGNSNSIDNRETNDDDDDDDRPTFKPYYYQKPAIPFQPPVKIRTTTAKYQQIGGKIEDFGGYSYPKPQNPMMYPERPIKTTTEQLIDLPGASARALTFRKN